MPGYQMRRYLENQDKLLTKYNGQIIALQNGQVLGAYPTKLAAWEDMARRDLTDGEYIIIKCTPGDEAYTTNWASCLASEDDLSEA